MTTGRLLRVGLYCFDDVEELDLVGPWEVFAAWAEHSPLRPEVLTFSADGAGVRCAHGLRVLPDCGRDEAGDLTVLVVPGGRGSRAVAADPTQLAWLREVAARTPVVASVCTGALVLGAAGLLSGRPATTHHGAFDELAATDPTVLVDTEARFVDDGDVVTSAGISAGIDLALHLVERLDDLEQARWVRWNMQYDPAPPV